MADRKELAEWENRQSRTFAKWCNMYLSKKGHEDRVGAQGYEFADSWKDGVLGMKLMNACFGVAMPKKYHKPPVSMEVKRKDNVARTLKMIKEAEVKTVGLKDINFLDGNFNFMCGLVWTTIQRFNLIDMDDDSQTMKQGLLIWCQKKTQGYNGVNGNINNFSTDWRNGNAFLALVDRHTSGLVNYDGQYDESPEEKLDAAFTACEGLGIMRLLEIDDCTVDRPDEKSVMTYVGELFKLFSKEDLKENAANHIAKFLNFNRRIDALAGDYEQRFREFEEWVNTKCNDFGSADSPTDNTGCSEASNAYKSFLLDEKPQRMADVVDLMDLYANLQGELKVNGRNPYAPAEDVNPSRLPELKNMLQTAEAEYSQMIRDTRMGFLEKVEEAGVDDSKRAEFERSFDAFDADNSGHMNKVEFQAALSAVGVSLSGEGDVDRVFNELKSSDDHVSRESYLGYLDSFFSQSDSVDAIMKSLQVLGDPECANEDMFNQRPLTPEDVEYLMSRCEDGSLAAYVNSCFQ